MMLSDNSNCSSRSHFDVIFVVLAEKYSLGILQADSCRKQLLSSPSAQFAHPLMTNYEVLGRREQEHAW